MKAVIRSAVAAFALAGVALCAQAQSKLEKPDVHIAVGGKAAFYYLPLTIAEQLGYFKDEGLNLKISDFRGGSKALAAVVGGSADVVSGAYEHTINLQSKKLYFQAFALEGRLPQIVLGVATAKAKNFHSFKDLKGMKVGVTAPGSSTNYLVKQLLSKAGLDPNNDVAIVGVGTGATAVAALKSGEIDALSNVDPVMTKLEKEGAIKIVADTRTLKGTREIWGAPLPAGCLYAPIEFVKKNPHTVQALTNAIVRADKWIAKASAEDVVKVVPKAYLLGDEDLYKSTYNNVKEAISRDGMISPAGARATLAALRNFVPSVKAAKIDLSKTYTNKFAKKANAKYK